MISKSVDAELARWASAQLLFWEGQRLSLKEFEVHSRHVNDRDHHTFVFVISDQIVSLMSKPKHYADVDLQSDRNKHWYRLKLYLRFFEEVVQQHCPGLECKVVMSMDDHAPKTTFPVFAFQKPRGSHAILIPDIDAIGAAFYIDARDTLFYEDKINKAVFVGSTTGAMHTMQSVRTLSNERLRLGRFFRETPNVNFSLPNIVQCDSLETENAIRALGFGTGALSWPQQLIYRFLISADGNGATCSRVAMALKSNSVLLKFFSENNLYFFDAMQPYRDYIPIKNPGDVVAIINAERRTPGTCEMIAKGGAAFFEAYLNREPAIHYTALLLQRYAAMFSQKTESPLVKAKCIAHLSRRGDVIFDLDGWVGDPGNATALEGFEIDFQSGLHNGDLVCQFIIRQDGDWTTISDGGFVGSRGRSTPLLGLAFDLIGPARERYHCEYRCASVDGHVTEIRGNGDHCECDGRALAAFQLKLTEKNKSLSSPV